jgi:hypothetical protein
VAVEEAVGLGVDVVHGGNFKFQIPKFNLWKRGKLTQLADGVFDLIDDVGPRFCGQGRCLTSKSLISNRWCDWIG